MTAPAAPDFDLPLRIKAAMYFRLLALQGSWNYETLLGTGVGFVMEPALRLLPGGLDGQAYRAALARGVLITQAFIACVNPELFSGFAVNHFCQTYIGHAGFALIVNVQAD